jgi:putative transcriptional regulator
MSDQMSLANHLLIATPSLSDPNFFHSVIYICEHHTQGTVGLIINHPMKHHINIVFEQLDIEPTTPMKNQDPLLFGGPVQPERGFVLHRPTGTWTSSLILVPDAVTITTSNDIIRAIALDTGPKDALVILGYVAWEQYQLETEIQKDAWMVCPFKPELLYDVPFEERWVAAGLTLGVNMNQLTFGVGHA